MDTTEAAGGTAIKLSMYKIDRSKQMRADHFDRLFEKQLGGIPCGGFLNPKIVEESDCQIIFRCNYNNFEGDHDSWHYGFDLKTRQFYAA